MKLHRRILFITLSIGSLLAAARVGAADRRPSTDDLMVAVANQVPAFGGMFIGRDGLLRMYLLDPRQSAAAQTAIAAVFGRGRVSFSGAQAVQARYGFTQLKAWHDRASARPSAEA